MGFPRTKQKWRDRIRQTYTAETGSADYSAPEFEAWLHLRGYLAEETDQ